MQQRDCADEREVFHVVAARPRAIAQEGELHREGVDDVDGFEEALGILVGVEDTLFLQVALQAAEHFCLALEQVDGFGLLARFVDGQDEAAVEQLFVNIDRRRGEEDHDRAFDVVFLSFHATLFVFARGSDGEFTFGLQEL